ncbi:expressed protein [Dictyostelium purpureum]|uniref:Expressed protein n=1 Tax=Dictyostelium purpureum TaxID=5786 RepID=F0ZEB3_DICPU|nr:uncharacterized protein DICPUDRAFT_97157 [Dictyostelium purpureum]EGC37725.1 expressed protein [Dictyostelium purpureum]|eukprot:XP_003285746.1 expressed protein [Dictyostelium purpureum]
MQSENILENILKSINTHSLSSCLSLLQNLELPKQNIFVESPESPVANDMPKLLEEKSVWSFSFYGCLQQLTIIRSWVPNLSKLPKIQKKRLWEQCTSMKIFLTQNSSESEDKTFTKNPNFKELIEKWTNNPTNYLASITILFGAVGYLIKNNIIKNEYYYPTENIPVYYYDSDQEETHSKKKKKTVHNSNSLNQSSSSLSTSTSSTSSTSSTPSSSVTSSPIPRSVSLPSLPTRRSQRNSLNKTQNNIQLNKSSNTTTTTTTSSPESYTPSSSQISSPITPMDSLLDEIESDEDYFEEKPKKKKSNNKSNNKNKSPKRKMLSESYDYVPSMSPTKEFSTSSSAIFQSPLLGIVNDEIELIDTEYIDEINNTKKLDLTSSLISIKNYNNNSSKENGLALLSSASSIDTFGLLDNQMDSLFGLANIATSEL